MSKLVPVDIQGAKGRVELRPPGLLRGARLFQDGRPAPWHRRGKSWLVALEDGDQVEVRFLPVSWLHTLPCLEIAGRRVDLGRRIPTALLVLALVPLLLVPLGGALGGLLGAIAAMANLSIARGSRNTGSKAALMVGILVLAGAVVTGVATGIQLLLGEVDQSASVAADPAQPRLPEAKLPEGPGWLRIESFAVKIPPGWVDLSPHAPAENFTGLAPAFVRQIKSRSNMAIAMDLAHGNDGFIENVSIELASCPDVELTAASIRSKAFERGFQAAVAKLPNASAKLLDRALIQIDGVPVARLQRRLTIKGQPTVMNLGYLLTGAGGRCAMVYYSTTPEKFEQYRPLFEASAMQSRGLVRPRANRSGGSYVAGFAAGFTIFAGISIALVVAALRRRTSKTKPTQAL